MAKWTPSPEIGIFSFILVISSIASLNHAVTYRLKNINKGYSVEAFNLQRSNRVRRSNDETANTTTETSPSNIFSTTPTTTITSAENRDYYKYSLVNGKDFDSKWINLDGSNKGLPTVKHVSLSNAHRLGASIKLKYNFIFYGHYVSTVTITTGGFLYLSDFIHKHITQTQYMAPLMANIDTSIGKQSDVYYAYNNTIFVAEWRNVFILDHQESGPFHFQIVWFSDGLIYFNYMELPLPIKSISDKKHPVTVGLSDAFYLDSYLGRIIRRRIVEYHSVNLLHVDIRSRTTVILELLPTCIQIRDCLKCVTAKIGFACNWCPKVGYCSDGFDRLRQIYYANDCDKISVNTTSCDETWTARPTPAPQGTKKKDTSKGNKSGAVVAVVVVVLLLLALIVSLVGWFIFAYRNPSSSSGRWLIEHRPQNLKANFSKLNIFNYFKGSGNSGDKYEVRIGSAGSQSNA